MSKLKISGKIIDDLPFVPKFLKDPMNHYNNRMNATYLYSEKVVILIKKALERNLPYKKIRAFLLKHYHKESIKKVLDFVEEFSKRAPSGFSKDSKEDLKEIRNHLKIYEKNQFKKNK
jgi:hypothetical protein